MEFDEETQEKVNGPPFFKKKKKQFKKKQKWNLLWRYYNI